MTDNTAAQPDTRDPGETELQFLAKVFEALFAARHEGRRFPLDIRKTTYTKCSYFVSGKTSEPHDAIYLADAVNLLDHLCNLPFKSKLNANALLTLNVDSAPLMGMMIQQLGRDIDGLPIADEDKTTLKALYEGIKRTPKENEPAIAVPPEGAIDVRGVDDYIGKGRMEFLAHVMRALYVSTLDDKDSFQGALILSRPEGPTAYVIDCEMTAPPHPSTNDNYAMDRWHDARAQETIRLAHVLGMLKTIEPNLNIYPHATEIARDTPAAFERSIVEIGRNIHRLPLDEATKDALQTFFDHSRGSQAR